MAAARLLLCYLILILTSGIHLTNTITDPRDVTILRSLKDQWENTPPSWQKSDDPCGTSWDGVTCNNSRVTGLGLSTMGLKEKLSGDIGGLTELISLDLSFNRGLTGSLSPRIGDLQKLNILILAGCTFNGSIPRELGKLAELSFLNLAHNELAGTLPNLSGMNSLNYLDLSNNSFHKAEAPVWFSTLQSLTTLVVEYGSLHGSVPQKLFALPQLQQVKLRNNEFNDTLNMGGISGRQLTLVDLQNNEISSITLGSGYKNTLILIGNPVCGTVLGNTNYCQLQQQSAKPYSTSLANCGSKSCPADQKVSPQSCDCAYPYEGTFYFRGPSFRELSNVNTFHSLEMSLWVKLDLTPGTVSLQNPFFNIDDYLQVQLELFPPTGKFFSRSEVERIGFKLSNQTYKPPPEFGPYYFIASPYTFQVERGETSISSRQVIGIAIGCTILVLLLFGLAIYAIQQKENY